MKKRAFGFVIFLSAFLAGYFLVPKTSVVETRKIDVLKIARVEPEVPFSDESLETMEEINDDREQDSFRIKLLEVGEAFHGDEVDAKNGENWLGLFANGKDDSVRSTIIRINRVHDPIVDDKPTARTGKDVAVSSVRKPIFLIKNAKAVREGKVGTIFRGLTQDEMIASSDTDLSLNEKLTRLDKNFLQTYNIGGKEYVLRVIKAKNSNGEKLLALALEFQGSRQILHTMQTSYEGEIGVKEWLGQVGTLYWVGDLDGDRRPDFYIDLFWHDNVSDRVLFLSTEAKEGQLVRKAARFTTTGC